jgi:hypothetical protein
MYLMKLVARFPKLTTFKKGEDRRKLHRYVEHRLGKKPSELNRVEFVFLGGETQ